MDSIESFFVCVGILGGAVTFFMALAALMKIAGLGDRVAALQRELEMMRAAAAQARKTGEASTGLRAMETPRVVPPAPTVVPPVPMVAPVVARAVGRPETTEQLRAKLEGLREAKKPVGVPAPPAVPVPEKQPSGSIPTVIPAAAGERAAQSRAGFEQFVGMKLFVIVGAVALALAGIFLVQYAVKNNYFGPGVRVIMGVAAGAGLIGAGQWRRKKEAFIAQGLSAAGIVALFAAVFAATTLYHFLVPVAGFLLLACVTAGTVLLALQRPGGGALIAGLGLIGGFVTPLLVRTDAPNVPGLFGYLLLLHVGLIAVTRMRGWKILAALSVMAASGWLIVWVMAMPWRAADGPLLGGFLLATVATMAVATMSEPEKWGGLGARLLTWLAGALGLAATCLLLGRSGFSNLEWSYFALLAAGAFWLGRMRGQYEGLAWVSSAAVLAMLAAWGLFGGAESARFWEWGETLRLADAGELLRLKGWMLGFGVASVMAAYGCMWGSAAPVRWSWLAAVLAVAYVGVAYEVIGRPPRAESWAWVAAGAAGVTIGMTVPVYWRRGKMRTGEEALAVLGHGVLMLLAIALPMAWTDGALTAAWAGLMVIVVLAAWQIRVPAMLLGMLGLFGWLAVRGLLFWTTLAEPVGGNLWWNPIVWAYGSLVVATVAAAMIVERWRNRGAMPMTVAGLLPESGTISALLQVGATAAGFLLLTLEVRWAFHGGRLEEGTWLLRERGTYAAAWLLMACGLIWLGTARGRRILVACGRVVAGIGLVYAVAGLVVVNPLWVHEAVGSVAVVNDLLFVYGIPAGLCAAAVFLLSVGKGSNRAMGEAAKGVGLVLLVALVTLEVRQGFQGEFLDGWHVGFVERGTYVIAWMILSAGMLWAGRRFIDSMVLGAGMIVASGALVFAVGICGVVLNPLWDHVGVGTVPVANWLVYVFGLSALGAGLMGRALWEREGREGMLGRAAGVAGLVLVFILVTLEVRQVFHGAFLDVGERSHAEMASYSMAWAALGGVLLVAGIVRGSAIFRWASLLLMLMTICKVFLVDMADLKDLLRVLSFAGLGVSLMGLAFVYQRFVFRKVEMMQG